MTQPRPFLRLGTRGSALARAQAEATRSRLAAAHGIEVAEIAIEIISVTGDRIVDRPLAEAGGKGLFTKEIEEALAAGRIDAAVHSAKDLATVLPPGLILAATLPREDARDVLVSRGATRFEDLPAGARFGSASLRRLALALRARPDLKPHLLRGNVETRLKRVAEDALDATVLAAAGLKRLGLLTRLPAGVVATALDPATFVPAVGQGIIALEVRQSDARTRALLAAADDAPTSAALAAERAFLGVLDGSCRTPIGGYAQLEHGELRFAGIVLLPDGSAAHEITRRGSATDAAALGAEAGAALLAKAGAAFLSAFTGR